MKFKKCKIVMLATDNEVGVGSIFKRNRSSINDDLVININPRITKSQGEFIAQHLYVLSDDEIKVGDNVLYDVSGYQGSTAKLRYLCGKVTNTDEVGHANEHYHTTVGDWHCDLCKKIIASTDPLLNLPTVSNAFIEKYCKNDGIDEVMVGYEELEFLINPILYIRNNQISIKPVPTKSYSRNEVVELIRKLCGDYPHPAISPDEMADRFIEKNM